MWWRIAKAVAGFTASAYMNDVVVKPQRVAQLARSYAIKVGKPLLNIGAGTSNSSLRTILFGPTLWGDVNIDIAAPKNMPHGPGQVSWGDAHDLSVWPDKHFGAIIASHVLEHLERPDIALQEWNRVADKVFVVVPTWWAPHTWMHPGHLWFIDPDLKAAKPLHIQRYRNLPLRSQNVVGSRKWPAPPAEERLENQSDAGIPVSPSLKSSQGSPESRLQPARPSSRVEPQPSVMPENVPKPLVPAKRSLR